MRDYRDAKAMARHLREALAHKGVSLGHTDCLELIARSFGLKDWNVLAAMIEAGSPAANVPAANLPQPPPDRPVWSGPALLLRDIVIFPKQTAPLFIGRAMSRRALTRALQGEQEVLLVTQKERADDDPALDGLYGVGVIADVLERAILTQAEAKLVVRGRQRARLLALSDEDGLRRAEAVPTPPDPAGGPETAPLVRSAAAAFQAYAAAGSPISESAPPWLTEVTHPGVLADLIAGHARLSVAQKQSVLETPDPRRRLERVVRLISPAAPKAA